MLGRYRLERPIGRGGHGTVWEAVDERLERPVAIKAVAHDESGVGRRAEREARVAARLSHPGIVTLYEAGADDEAVYLVSELVRGRAMAELGAAGALSERDLCRIGIALCSALAHAHARGVIHRDVKPQNVIVVAEPAAGAGFAKLTDFGVAHLRGDEALTRTGDVVGTIAYMAPEQAEGAAVTAAADVYSLALVLYEGWTGSGPQRAIAARLGGRPLAPLGAIRPDLPPTLCRVIDAALDRRPELRPALQELEAELRAAVELLSDEGGLDEPATRRRFGIAPAPARPLLPAPAWAARMAAGAAAGAIVLLGLDRLATGPPSFSPLAAAAGASLIVALLPRLGWLAAAAAVLGWLASPEGGRQGTALVLAAAAFPTALLLPRAGLLWSVPALAPLLGAAGLAPAFIAVAGLASSAWRRAGLALAGLAWLAAVELVTGDVLLFGPADGATEAASWRDSVLGAARDALYPSLEALAFMPALVWAALALALGVVLRPRSFRLAAGGVALWAVATVATHAWLGEVLAARAAAADARGAVAGAVVGALAALAVRSIGHRQRRLEGPLVP